ncbi:hypothetical protein Droror1_Dr00021338 [Drosera rotundifolia]
MSMSLLDRFAVLENKPMCYSKLRNQKFKHLHTEYILNFTTSRHKYQALLLLILQVLLLRSKWMSFLEHTCDDSLAKLNMQQQVKAQAGWFHRPTSMLSSKKWLSCWFPQDNPAYLLSFATYLNQQEDHRELIKPYFASIRTCLLVGRKRTGCGIFMMVVQHKNHGRALLFVTLVLFLKSVLICRRAQLSIYHNVSSIDLECKQHVTNGLSSSLRASSL